MRPVRIPEFSLRKRISAAGARLYSQMPLRPVFDRIEHQALDPDDQNDQRDNDGEHERRIQALTRDIEKMTKPDFRSKKLGYQCDLPGNSVGHANRREDKRK